MLRTSKTRGAVLWLLAATLLAGLVYQHLPHDGFVYPKAMAAKTQIAVLKQAIEMFQVDTGRLPHGSNGLMELIQRPNDVTNWLGPYLDANPSDPWGRAYLYEYPGRHGTNLFDLSSMGPDGKPGTADDIGNWLDK